MRVTPDRTIMLAAWLPTPPSPTTITKAPCSLSKLSRPKKYLTREYISS